MRLAERMLRKHNLSRADVMMGAEDASVNGDLVKVHIRNPQTKRPCVTKQWFQSLAGAMTRHFKCKYYFVVRAGKHCYFSFYGLASSAFAAALAFETAFNRIMTLAARHTVPGDEYDRKRRAGEVTVCRGAYTRAARVSYCEGVATGLLQRVREAEAAAPADEVEAEATTREEETRLACVSEKVEASVLTAHNVKLRDRNPNRYARTPRRAASYTAGKRDSSHIDLQQRALA